MDHIKKAILKAKAAQASGLRTPLVPGARSDLAERSESYPASALPILQLNRRHLELNRIVAHEPHNSNSVGFDVLRTRVLQIMRDRGWQTLMVTSPNIGCGKTVTAINLAISLARQSACNAVLADCDFRKPHVAKYLGFQPERDLYDVISGEASLQEVMRNIDIAGPGLGVLASRSVVPRPSEVLSSLAMRNVVAAIKSLSPDTIAIFDVPPMLVADDVLAFMPEVDAVLLIAAPDQSTYSEMESCLLNIPEGKLIGPVITKSIEKSEMEHSYYY